MSKFGTTPDGLQFILEPHFDSCGNLYFSVFTIEGERVNSGGYDEKLGNKQTVDACINAVSNGINFTVLKG